MATVINEDWSIWFASHKTKVEKPCAQSGIPRSGSLLQAVDGFLEMTDMIRKRWMSEPWWLGHVDIFSESTMQEGFGDVELSNVPTEGDSYR